MLTIPSFISDVSDAMAVCIPTIKDSPLCKENAEGASVGSMKNTQSVSGFGFVVASPIRKSW